MSGLRRRRKRKDWLGRDDCGRLQSAVVAAWQRRAAPSPPRQYTHTHRSTPQAARLSNATTAPGPCAHLARPLERHQVRDLERVEANVAGHGACKVRRAAYRVSQRLSRERLQRLLPTAAENIYHTTGDNSALSSGQARAPSSAGGFLRKGMAWDFSCGDSSRAVAVRDWPFQRDGCCRGRRHKLALGASPPLAAAWQASARRRRRWRRQRQVGSDLHGDGADARRGRLHGQLRREAHREGGGGQHNGAIDSRGCGGERSSAARGKADGAIYRGDAEVRGGRRGTEAAQEAPQGSFSSRVQSRAAKRRLRWPGGGQAGGAEWLPAAAWGAPGPWAAWRGD